MGVIDAVIDAVIDVLLQLLWKSHSLSGVTGPLISYSIGFHGETFCFEAKYRKFKAGKPLVSTSGTFGLNK